MLPEFDGSGNLPASIYWVEWDEFVERFSGSNKRQVLIKGLKKAASLLARAGCRALYVDGSFVTAKEVPGDFDACWDLTGVDDTKLDPVFLDFSNRRRAQKARFGGELFPAEWPSGISGRNFSSVFSDRSGWEPERNRCLRFNTVESMIKNQRQYRVTKTQLAKFDEAIAELKASQAERSHVPPLLRKAELAALESQAEDLRSEIKGYEALQSGHVRTFSLKSLGELPTALIQARIACKMTQEQLAKRITFEPQQIQ